jgi:putative ABC transport system substrate-binding protein
MRRREFIGLFGGAALAWPLAGRAQPSDKIARVGVLGPSRENPVSGPGYAIFIAELRKLGFDDGRNLQVEFGRTDEEAAGAFAAANELVARKADVLVANGPEITLQAAAAARPPVPIVMLASNFDPFARGYVKSLADPGGNITGLFYR